MKELKYETKTTFHVDYSDFEEWVNDRFNIPLGKYGEGFSFLADQESGNDTSHEFSANSTLSKWDQDHLDRWIESGFTSGWITPAIISQAVHVGDLPEGTYIIRVCW